MNKLLITRVDGRILTVLTEDSRAIQMEYEEEEERRQEELDKKVVAYIKSLSKDELRQTLYEVLYDGADWVFERFVREHIDY